MSYDGYDSDTAVVATPRRQRRRREICRSFTCISPWFLFWRWFNGGKSRGSRNRFVERKREMEKMKGDSDVKRKSGMVSSSSREDFPAEIGKEASFNLGVGFGLIYLVGNELKKMAELRKRNELLLQNFHTEIKNQDKRSLYMPSRSSISSSCSKTCVRETLYAEEHDSGQYLSPDDVERPDIGFGSDRFRRETSLRMDQLEAELEAEFGRLQLQMDEEFFLKYTQQQYPKVNMEDNAPELSNNEFYGVSPRDLERKLHQVLEARQQERINELESALDYAMQQVLEKETELSCWKDTARLISQHLPAIPSLLMKVRKQAVEPEFEVGQTSKSWVKNSIYKCNIQAI